MAVRVRTISSQRSTQRSTRCARDAPGISRSMARSASSPSATWTRIDARKRSAIARSLNRVPRAL
jgi:hypothetical protein